VLDRLLQLAAVADLVELRVPVDVGLGLQPGGVAGAGGGEKEQGCAGPAGHEGLQGSSRHSPQEREGSLSGKRALLRPADRCRTAPTRARWGVTSPRHAARELASPPDPCSGPHAATTVPPPLPEGVKHLV